jgi:hypothetical protein
MPCHKIGLATCILGKGENADIKKADTTEQFWDQTYFQLRLPKSAGIMGNSANQTSEAKP